jgi:hypothetical protein
MLIIGFLMKYVYIALVSVFCLTSNMVNGWWDYSRSIVTYEVIENWILDGIRDNAEYLVIIYSFSSNNYWPYYVYPGESIQEVRRAIYSPPRGYDYSQSVTITNEFNLDHEAAIRGLK